MFSLPFFVCFLCVHVHLYMHVFCAQDMTVVCEDEIQKLKKLERNESGMCTHMYSTDRI